MNQVVFLFAQQDISEMNTKLQSEILYQLRQTLSKDKKDDTQPSPTGESDGEKNANLSGSTDSQMEEAPGETTPMQSTAKDAEPSEPTFTDLQRAVWGELPQRVQETLREEPTANEIPAYRKMIETYYQLLKKQEGNR